MSLPVDLGETQDRSGKKSLISKKDGVHKVLLFNERNFEMYSQAQVVQITSMGERKQTQVQNSQEGKGLTEH